MPFCSVCGARYDPGPERCARCGHSLPLSPPPVDAADQSEAQPDIRFRRAFAGLVDLAIVAAMAGFAVRIFLIGFPVRSRISMFVIPIVAAVLPAAYIVLRDAIGGKSFGKLLVGLTVIDPVRRRRAGFIDSFMRNLVFGFTVLPVVGWAITAGIAATAGFAILSGRSARIGEGLTDTRVMDDRAAEMRL